MPRSFSDAQEDKTRTCSTDWSGAKEMPRIGRSTLPNWMIWLTELRMMSTGTAKPTPLFAPDGEYMAVLMPAEHLNSLDI